VLEVSEQRTYIHNPAVLARYLPDPVVDQILKAGDAASTDIDLGFHITRLQNLLQRIESYVPEYAGVAHGKVLGSGPGSTSRVYGTLLAADLSGFTAFSARLSTLGSEGAELVARTINDLFSALLGALADWGGNLLKLSGDALTVPSGTFTETVDLLASAQALASAPPGQPTELAFEVTASAGGQAIHRFANGRQLQLEIRYTPAGLAGVDPRKLVVYALDENTGAWSFAGIRTTADPANQRLTAILEHLTRMRVTGINVNLTRLPIVLR